MRLRVSGARSVSEVYMDKFKLLVLLKPKGVSEQPALERAAQYARLMPDIEVTACRIFSNYTERDQGQLASGALADFEVLMRHFDSMKDRCQLKVMFNHDVSEGFVQEAVRGGYNLAIISANRRNTIKDLFVSTIDSNIMRKTEVPLLVVRNAQVAASQGQAILIALNISDDDNSHALDNYLVRSAKRFASYFNGQVHLVNCVLPQNRGYRATATSASKFMGGDFIRERERRLEIYKNVALEFAAEHGIEPKNVHVREGRVDVELPRLCAKLKACMVCMGTTPRSKFFGSGDSLASELVLEQIHGDVYVVSSAHITAQERKQKAETSDGKA